MAGTTGYPRLMAAGGSANDAFLDAITAAVDTLDTYVARVNASAVIAAGDNTSFKMQGLNGPAVSGASRTVKLLGRLGSEDQTFLDALNAIADTFTAYRTAVNASAAIVAGDTTCYKVQDVNGAAVSGATVFYRSTSRFDTDLDDLETQINGMVEALSQFASAWNLKQGGTPTTLVVSTVKRLRPFSRPATPGDDTARNIAVDGGNSQSATVATQPTTALTVAITDDSGTAVNGDAVLWAIDGDGFITASSQTNSGGIASATPTLGTTAGTYTVTATSSTGESVSFTLTGTAAAAAAIGANSVTDQSGTTSTAVTTPPSVLVRDAYGNVKSGTTVTFAVTAGGGSRDPATVNTSSVGVATLTSWTLGATAGLNTLTATAAGLTGSPVTFNANAAATAPTQIAIQSGGAQTGITAGQAATATVARVKDVSNNAVEGVTVSATVTTGSGTLSVASAVTDASGDASFTYTTDELVETATLTFSFTNAAGTTVSTTTTIASTFGTASKLAIQTQPSSSGSSGTALSQQPIILIQDANGNTVTNSTATVTASVQSGNATISAGSTKAAVAGVATFSGLILVDTDAGANVLRFSSGALTVVDSGNVTLAPPVPVALQFSGSISTIVEDTGILNVTVHVVDSSNVIVPGATNAVTIALTTPGGATLGGTTTKNAMAGIASFTTDNTVDTAGTYTLTATASGLTSAVSGNFTVSSAPSGGHPNEPSGFTQIHDSQFVGYTTTSPSVNGTGIDGLTRYATGNTGREVTDTVAPYNGSGVFRVTFNNGATQGTGPEHLWPGSGTQTFYQTTNYSELYTSFWVRVDADYRTPSTANPGTAVQKLFHIEGLCDSAGTGQGGSLIVPAITGLNDSTTSQLKLGIRYQNLSTANGAATSFNGATININRNQWYQVEVYLKYNTGTAADGICTMYVDGTQRTQLTNLTIRNGGTKEWTTIKLNPTYGGVGVVTGPQYLYYADWYSSGKA